MRLLVHVRLNALQGAITVCVGLISMYVCGTWSLTRTYDIPPGYFSRITYVILYEVVDRESKDPGQPHNTRWLSPAQRRLAQVRLAEDAGEADEDGKHET